MADNKFAYMDMPLQIGFQYAGPLDKYVQFATRAEADAWLTGALAYEGALVRVKETTTDNLWHVYKVDMVDGVLTFNSASELPLTDGKLDNKFFNTTVDTVSAGKLVVTNADGLVDQALLNVTVTGGTSEEAGKLVKINSNGLVDQSLLNVTAVGGAETVGKIVKVGEDGVIDSSLIPSIALGEDLGAYADWATAEAGVAHAPEHGDTIAIGDGEDKAIYVCLNPAAATFEEKFTLLRPASGVVAISDFNAHTASNIHITSDEREAWNKKLDTEDIPALVADKLVKGDIVAGTNISVDVAEDGNTVTINNTYTLNSATTTTLGGVIVGGGLNVATEDVMDGDTVSVKKGTISINMNTLYGHFYTKSEIDNKNFYVVKSGEEDKVLTTYDFNNEYKTKVDSLVGMFDNYELPVATETTAGIVKVGSGLSVAEDGTVSANILWTKEAFPALTSAGEGANKYYEWNKVCEVKIFDENNGMVFPAEYKVDVVAKTTRIEFPADFPADGEDTTKWTVLVGPSIQ